VRAETPRARRSWWSRSRRRAIPSQRRSRSPPMPASAVTRRMIWTTDTITRCAWGRRTPIAAAVLACRLPHLCCHPRMQISSQVLLSCSARWARAYPAGQLSLFTVLNLESDPEHCSLHAGRECDGRKHNSSAKQWQCCRGGFIIPVSPSAGAQHRVSLVSSCQSDAEFLHSSRSERVVRRCVCGDVTGITPWTPMLESADERCAPSMDEAVSHEL